MRLIDLYKILQSRHTAITITLSWLTRNQPTEASGLIEGPVMNIAQFQKERTWI